MKGNIMRISQVRFRQTLFICAAILITVVLVIGLGVIPSVKGEVERGATLQMAVYAFWVNIGFSIISTVIIGLVAKRSMKREWFSTALLIACGLVVFLLGFSCIDAASAYSDHGESMRIASVLLYICGTVDYLIAISIMFVAILRTKNE